jgi:tetratricopeptide (TPR) repeat protein
MTRLSVFLVLVLFLSSAQAAFLFPEQPPVASSTADDPALKSYQDGLEALRDKRLPDAEEAFKAALKANPRMVQALIGLADVALKRDARDEARASLDKAIQIAPTNDSVQHALGLFHASGRDYPAAETALKKAIELNPENLAARNALGSLYANAMKRPSDAVAAYRAAVEIDPRQIEARIGLAQALAATGQFSAAETELVAASKAQPNSPFPQLVLGRMHFSRGDTEAGIEAIDAALKVDPDFVPALLDKGDALALAGETDAALALYDRAIARNGNNAAAHFKRAVLLQQQGRNTEARQGYLDVIAIDQQFAPAYNNLAWMQADSRDRLDEAAQWAATAIRLDADNAAYRDTQAWVFRAQRKFDEAETVLEKATTMQPPIADVHYHLGVVYLDRGKADPARRAFTEALAIDPKHAEAAAALEKLNAGVTP